MSKGEHPEQWHLRPEADDERHRLGADFAVLLEPVAAALAATDARHPDADPELGVVKE